jgi:hypothetical protein
MTGPNAFGDGRIFDVYVHSGMGAYICGEEVIRNTMFCFVFLFFFFFFFFGWIFCLNKKKFVDGAD